MNCPPVHDHADNIGFWILWVLCVIGLIIAIVASSPHDEDYRPHRAWLWLSIGAMVVWVFPVLVRVYGVVLG